MVADHLKTNRTTLPWYADSGELGSEARSVCPGAIPNPSAEDRATDADRAAESRQ
jgi:hypothetical protein